MKKIFQAAGILILGLSLTQCTKEQIVEAIVPAGHLYVNGTAFPIGSNIINSAYNNTNFHQGGPGAAQLNSRTFSILKGTTTSQANAETINLNVSYPGNQASINGTYPLDIADVTTAATYGICGFTDSNTTFGVQPQNSTGTVTITDNGNNNFKIVFTNVTLKNSNAALGSKVITGYVETTFNEVN
jgi:hypothetical protein